MSTVSEHGFRVFGLGVLCVEPSTTKTSNVACCEHFRNSYMYNTCQSLHVTKRQKEISFLKVSPYQQQID